VVSERTSVFPVPPYVPLRRTRTGELGIKDPRQTRPMKDEHYKAFNSPQAYVPPTPHSDMHLDGGSMCLMNPLPPLGP